MKRILLVTDIFPPDIGGPATFIDELAHGLTAQGHRVTVICTTDLLDTSFDRKKPFRVKRFLRSHREIDHLKFRHGLASLILQHQLIFCNGLEWSVYRACELLRRVGIRREYVLKVVGDIAWEYSRNEGLTNLPFDDFQSATTFAEDQITHLIERRILLPKARVLL